MTDSRIQETPAQRKKRLMSWAAMHHLRVKAQKDGSYFVPSSRKGPNGKPICDYHVTPVATEHGPGWYCPCLWGYHNGAYIPGVTDIALCEHVAQVCKHEECAAREQQRAAAALIDAAERIMRGKPETMQDRRALASVAYEELCGGI